MGPIALVLLIGVLWAAGLLAVVSLCRAAARGDRALESRGLGPDTHHFHLVA